MCLRSQMALSSGAFPLRNTLSRICSRRAGRDCRARVVMPPRRYLYDPSFLARVVMVRKVSRLTVLGTEWSLEKM